MGAELSTQTGVEAARRHIESNVRQLESNVRQFENNVRQLAGIDTSRRRYEEHSDKDHASSHHREFVYDKSMPPPPPPYRSDDPEPFSPPPYSPGEGKHWKGSGKSDRKYNNMEGLGRSKSFKEIGVTNDGYLDPRVERAKSTGSRPTPRSERWYVSAMWDYNERVVMRDTDAGIVTYSGGRTERVNDGTERRRHHD